MLWFVDGKKAWGTFDFGGGRLVFVGELNEGPAVLDAGNDLGDLERQALGSPLDDMRGIRDSQA